MKQELEQLWQQQGEEQFIEVLSEFLVRKQTVTAEGICCWTLVRTPIEFDPDLLVEAAYICRNSTSQLSKLSVSDGVEFILNQSLSWWLPHVIAFHQPFVQACFQVWRLVVDEDNSAILVCDEGEEDSPQLVRQRLSYCHLPFELGQLVLYVCEQTLMLPSEFA